MTRFMGDRWKENVRIFFVLVDELVFFSSELTDLIAIQIHADKQMGCKFGFLK